MRRLQAPISLQARSTHTGEEVCSASTQPKLASVTKRDSRQLELPLQPRLTVITGQGEKKDEALASRDAVARVLMEAGADLLLRRISSERAEEIEQRVNEVLELFDRVDRHPLFLPILQRKLDQLEVLMRETRSTRKRRTR